ncbi:MAG: CopG family transcriptional regulator [Planctomycetota bacterium]
MPRRSKSSGKTTIKIPTPIYEKLSVLIEGAGYNSVTDFVVYVLRDLVGQCHDGQHLSQEQLEETRRRLKNLGYL